MARIVEFADVRRFEDPLNTLLLLRLEPLVFVVFERLMEFRKSLIEEIRARAHIGVSAN